MPKIEYSIDLKEGKEVRIAYLPQNPVFSAEQRKLKALAVPADILQPSRGLRGVQLPE